MFFSIKKEVNIMKKALSVLVMFLSFAILFSSCAQQKAEDATGEPSSAESRSLPMSSDSLKIDLGKAKLYFTTDKKNSVRSVKNDFSMIGSFCSDILFSSYRNDGDESIAPDNVNWGGYDIKNGELTKFINPDSVTADFSSEDSIIMNDTDLYEFTTPKHDESNNNKCVLMRASYSYSECAVELTIESASPTGIHMSKLNDDEFIFFDSDVMKYNVKTKKNDKFASAEAGVKILNACAYDNMVYIVCDVSGKKQLRAFDSAGKLQSTADFPNSSAIFNEFKVFGDYIFAGYHDAAIYKIQNGSISIFEKERDPAEIYLIHGNANATNTKNCPYVIFSKKYTSSNGKSSEYKLINLFNDKVYDISFTPEEGDFTVVSSVVTDEYGNLLVKMDSTDDNGETSPDCKYYKVDATAIKLMLGEKQ